MELVARRSGAAARAKALADRLGFQAAMDLSTFKGIDELAALNVTPIHREVLQSHVSRLRFLTTEIKRLESVIDDVAAHSEDTRNLMTIPGIGSYLALLIATEVFDIRRFVNSRRFAAYAGVAPGAFGSGGKVFHGHLCPNANRYLRWAFGEAAPHYTKACPQAKQKYERLKRAKGWKTARMAIGRHVALIVYHVLTEGRCYRVTA
jgi:transposase